MYNELKVLLAELPVLHDITAALTLSVCDTTERQLVPPETPVQILDHCTLYSFYYIQHFLFV